MPKKKMTKEKAEELCRSIGTTHGQVECVLFMFGGFTDNDTIIEFHRKVVHGDEETLDSIRARITDSREPFPPNDIALLGGLMGADSPYSEYLDLCVAYESAFMVSFVEQLAKVVVGIRSGEL